MIHLQGPASAPGDAKQTPQLQLLDNNSYASKQLAVSSVERVKLSKSSDVERVVTNTVPHCSPAAVLHHHQHIRLIMNESHQHHTLWPTGEQRMIRHTHNGTPTLDMIVVNMTCVQSPEQTSIAAASQMGAWQPSPAAPHPPHCLPPAAAAAVQQA